MTIEQLLSGNNVPANELKNRFLVKSIKTNIVRSLQDFPSQLLDKVEKLIVRVADGSICKNDYCCMGANTPEATTMVLPEELKPELIKAIKETALKQLDEYKRMVDTIFSDSSKVSKPVKHPVEKKVEIEIEAKPIVSAPDYFGY